MIAHSRITGAVHESQESGLVACIQDFVSRILGYTDPAKNFTCVAVAILGTWFWTTSAGDIVRLMQKQ
jgi:hypothetical protein